MGRQFWKQLGREHGISSDGTGNQLTDAEDQPGVFFQETSPNRFTPRAILIDLEPKVIKSVVSEASFFAERNVHLADDGIGAGNNWVQGFQYGSGHSDELLDMIDKELDSCDSPEAFQLVHSVGGGTGSGVGSYLLEALSDRHPKKIVTTCSIFPSTEQTSDVVVQPYNTILTLKRLVENSDCNLIFENGALSSIASHCLKTSSPGVQDINQIIASVMSSMTNTLRFPSYMYNSLASILSLLVPTPDLHCIVPSFNPFTSDFVDHPKEIRKSSNSDAIVELVNRNWRMVTCDESVSKGRYLSALDILVNGTNLDLDIQRAVLKAQQRAQFTAWSSSSLHVVLAKRSPYLQAAEPNNGSISTGLMLANNTAISTFFRQTASQFDRLFKRQVFMDGYRKESWQDSDVVEEFNDSREVTQTLIDEYISAENEDYLDYGEDVSMS